MSLAPLAHAYGNAEGTQLWQLTMSANCNNKDLCEFPGGFWAWAVLYDDGTFDATIVGCGHSGGPIIDLSPPWGGAQSCRSDGYWTTYNGNFYITSETDTCVDSFSHGPPTTTTYDYGLPGMDTGVPLTPGHYSDHPAPGINTEIQVVYIGP